MTVKTDDSRGDIYKNDKNAELRCSPEPIVQVSKCPFFLICNLCCHTKSWLMKEEGLLHFVAKAHAWQIMDVGSNCPIRAM